MPRTPLVTLELAFLLALTLNLSGCGSSYSGTTLQTIDIAPISPSIAVGGTVQFTATGHYSDNTTADLTKQSNWTSSVTTVATVDNLGTTPGLAHGVGAGQSNITVSFAQGSSSVNASTNMNVH
jgi:hypothetical protein